MSLGQNARLRQLLNLLERGEVHRARQGCTTQTEWAARLGMTVDQFRAVTKRARELGHAVPSWSAFDIPSWATDDARPGHVVPSWSNSPQSITDDRLRLDIEANQSDSIDSRFDFDEEEPTKPDAEARTPPIAAGEYRKGDSSIARPIASHRTAARLSGSRAPFTRHLTRDDVPDGTVIGVLSDIHVPYHDEHAVRLAIECIEDAGASLIILNGDIADCGPSSRHQGKRQRDILRWGSTANSIAPGAWIYEWARTKRCIYLLGNHEAWVENEIAESPTMNVATPEGLMGLPENGDGWEVLPALSRVRLGNRVWEHGDGFFKSGSPGQNPGARLKAKAPDQTTSIGHCHIKHATFWTSEDECGNNRTRAAFFNGHISLPEAHSDYAGTRIQWQQSFEITRAWYDGDRPRFTTDQPEIFRDRNGKPIFEYQGKVYR